MCYYYYNVGPTHYLNLIIRNSKIHPCLTRQLEILIGETKPSHSPKHILFGVEGEGINKSDHGQPTLQGHQFDLIKAQKC